MKSACAVILIVASIIIGYPTDVHSQSSFRLQFGTAIPISKFGLYQINEYKSDPKIGLSGGTSYTYYLNKSNLGFFVGLDFLYNGLNNDYKKEVEKWDAQFGAAPPVFHAYYNMPISTGLRYNLFVDNVIRLTLNLGVTYNFLRITDLETEFYESYTDLSNSFGFKTGISAFFQERFYMDIDFLGLGKHNVTGGSIIGISNTVEEFSQPLNVYLLTLSIGLEL